MHKMALSGVLVMAEKFLFGDVSVIIFSHIPFRLAT